MEVLCKNRYVGRSFIQPDTRSRQLAVAKKFGALSENLMGRRVVLVDDSIVRGTTVGPIIQLLRQAGAKEVSEMGEAEREVLVLSLVLLTPTSPEIYI